MEMPENIWKYHKGSARDFIRAPEWATVRTRITRGGKVTGDVWLEKHALEARGVSIGFRKHGEFKVSKFPCAPYVEHIVAVREKI